MPADIAVFFDCDGTLVTHDRPYPRLLHDAAARAGVPEPAREPFVDAYGEAFFAAFEAFAEDPVLAGVRGGLRDVDVDADATDVADAVRELDATAIDTRPGAREALSAVAADRPVGVLTNGEVAQQRRKLRRHDLFGLLDAYVASYEVGAHKPDGAVFTAAAERLPADDHVYVGDSVEADVEGAREAGWDAVHVREEDDLVERLATAGVL